MRTFEGKVAAVTGAGSGLGRAMARDFARRGMRLALADNPPIQLPASSWQEVTGQLSL